MNETPTAGLYKSFWMGGFEGADHVNAQENKLDMVQGSGHLDHYRQDYQKLNKLGIYTIRESIGWRISQPSIDAPIDFSRAISFAKEAKEQGIQIIWTFMHYGTPAGVSLLDDSFIDHFVKYAVEAAKALKPYHTRPPVFNLINEISFLAWATSQTDFMWPYRGRPEGAKSEAAHEGYRTKCRLVRAVLKAMDAVRDVSPDARFLHVEPLLHVVAPEDRPDLAELAQEVRGYQWQTWELLKGSMEPHLGGHPDALDLIGVNYYYNGQMEVQTDKHLSWNPPDARRLPFSALLSEVSDRYQRPIIVSETGHFGDDRAQWLEYVLREVNVALKHGVNLQGLCIYPILDRPCWHDPSFIIRCGIINDTRTHHFGSLKTLRRWQHHFKRKTRNENPPSILPPTLELRFSTSTAPSIEAG
jgi:beta-glucosidase/6-phospho-beta-glucosidase/beta-galactosidase